MSVIFTQEMREELGQDLADLESLEKIKNEEECLKSTGVFCLP